MFIAIIEVGAKRKRDSGVLSKDWLAAGLNWQC